MVANSSLINHDWDDTKDLWVIPFCGDNFDLFSQCCATSVQVFTKRDAAPTRSNASLLQDIAGFPLVTDFRVEGPGIHWTTVVEIAAGFPPRQLRSLTLRLNRIEGQLNSSSFRRLSGLQELVLDDCQVWTLPEDGLGGLGTLTMLNMANNGITAVPSLLFAGMPMLQRVDFSNNWIQALPKQPFAALRNLTYLSFRDNRITQLDADTFSPLSRLETLLLDDNRMSSLPSDLFDSQVSLAFLNLCECELTELPVGIFDPLERLDWLCLYSNRLASVDERLFSRLTSLTGLNLRQNRLTSLPGNVFASLTRLETLFINGNRLVEFPAELFRATTRLQTLRLGANKVGALSPRLFEGLSSLKQLYSAELALSGGLEPGVFTALTSLEVLSLKQSELPSLPAGLLDTMSQLDSLSVYNNKITAVPPGLLANNRLLSFLSMGLNQISEIPSGLFDSQTALKILAMMGNRLQRLPDGVFTATSALTMLVLGDNELHSLPPGAFDNLSELAVLNLGDNWLGTPEENLFSPLVNLRWLSLGGNTITAVPRTLLSNSKQLHFLNMSDNLITSDVTDLVLDLPLLTALNISGNPDLSLSSYPWRRRNFTILDVSGTSVIPEAQMCQKNITLGLRGMVKPSASFLEAVVAHCWGIALIVDISENNLRNISRIQTAVETFYILLQKSESDSQAAEHLTSLQMRSSPITCSLSTRMRDQAPPSFLDWDAPTNAIDIVTVNFPSLMYDCQCSPGYVRSRDGMCEPFWSAARMAGVVAAGVVVAVASLLYLFLVPWYRRRKRRFMLGLEMGEYLLKEADNELQQLRQTWHIQWEDVCIGARVGGGGFGDVHAATWMSRPVACKRLREALRETETESFQAEAAVMSGLRHPNIVTFFGAGEDDRGCQFLVTEFMERGSLRHVLRNVRSHADLPWSMRLRFCSDIAAGVHFLHTRQPTMLHRDLKCDNVLLDDRWCAKVADFGTLRQLSHGHQRPPLPGGLPGPSAGKRGTRGPRMLSPPPQEEGAASRTGSASSQSSAAWSAGHMSMTASDLCGTVLWAAPEVLELGAEGLSQYGTASDVYSYGVVLFEIATCGATPFAHRDDLNFHHLLLKALKAGERPVLADGTEMPDGYKTLMECCWQTDAAARPTFAEVCRTVAQIAGTVTPPGS